jgi:hypothetical protein
MACETVAWHSCACCGGAVAVKKNRSGLAYYRCDHCGVHLQHHWARSSVKLLTAAGAVEEKPAPAVEDKPKKAAPDGPDAPKKAAPGSVAALFGL